MSFSETQLFVSNENHPSKRFEKISQNLHISNITTEAPRNSPDYDKLGKIKPAIEILNKTFKDNVQVSAFNSIDESMIRFKGRSHMKQYMPKKPIKTTTYLHEFQFYTGKVDSGTEENLGAKVILDLCESLPSHTLEAFDNFFTSLPLLEILFEKHIYSVGTVRINRKGLPDLMTGKNLNSEERKEEMIERKQKDGTKKKKKNFCPLSIKKYTEFMGGVDHFDHFRASYSLGRKSRKNWHRLFWFLLEAAVINALYISFGTAKYS